jgi:hypothetical protein
VAPFAAGSLNPTTDAILCALLVVHSHIGFEYVLSFVQIQDLDSFPSLVVSQDT